MPEVRSFIFLMLCFVLAYSGFGQNHNCVFIQNGIDLQTKLYRTEVAPALFFNYTPPQIKNELQENNLIECAGQVVKVDNQAALHLNLRVNSKKAQTVYGEIKNQHILKFTLIDGKEITVKCFAGSNGVISNDKNSYIYPIGFELSNRDLRALGKKEIDKIGIQWSSGYEEYTIYEVDFLMNQIACLEQATQKKPN